MVLLMLVRRRAGTCTGGVAGSRKVLVMLVPLYAPFGGTAGGLRAPRWCALFVENSLFALFAWRGGMSRMSAGERGVMKREAVRHAKESISWSSILPGSQHAPGSASDLLDETLGHRVETIRFAAAITNGFLLILMFIFWMWMLYSGSGLYPECACQTRADRSST